jgi:hypothetical protein
LTLLRSYDQVEADTVGRIVISLTMQSHIRSRVRFAQRLLDPDTLTSDDPRDIVLDILEELENKKAGKKAGEEKKSGKKVEGEVDEKKKVSTVRTRGSWRCFPRGARSLILISLPVGFDSFSGRTGKEAEMERRGQGRQRGSQGGETFEARNLNSRTESFAG